MHLSARRGFTLVELLVAVLLIDVGVLAMVAGTAAITRRQTAVRTRALAAQIAANRIQRLTAAPCAPVSGSAVQRDITERYASSLAAPGIRDIEDSVAFVTDGLPRAIVIRTRAAC